MTIARKLAVAAATAALASGGAAAAVGVTGSPAGAATKATHTRRATTARPARAQQQPAGSSAADTSTEVPENAPEQVEPSDGNLPGGGHADTGANADHQFDGVE